MYRILLVVLAVTGLILMALAIALLAYGIKKKMKAVTIIGCIVAVLLVLSFAGVLFLATL